jgi:hypothetical protein
MTYAEAAHYALMPKCGLAPGTLHIVPRNLLISVTLTASGQRQTAGHSRFAVSVAVNPEAICRYRYRVAGKSGYRCVDCRKRCHRDPRLVVLDSCSYKPRHAPPRLFLSKVLSLQTLTTTHQLLPTPTNQPTNQLDNMPGCGTAGCTCADCGCAQGACNCGKCKQSFTIAVG